MFASQSLPMGSVLHMTYGAKGNALLLRQLSLPHAYEFECCPNWQIGLNGNDE
jgi:hypothetical protein